MSPGLVRQDRRLLGVGLGPDREIVFSVLQLNDDAGSERILALFVELDALVTHHQLIGFRSVAFSAAWILAGSVEPARSIASTRTKKPCISRPVVSSISSPLFFLYISAIRAVGEPGGPTLHDDRSKTPCEILPTDLRNDGSEYPASSPSSRGGL